MSPVSSVRVLVLFVLRLERADADAVLLAKDQPLDDHLFDDLRPIAAEPFQAVTKREAAERAKLAHNFDPVGRAVVEVAPSFK